MRDDSLSALWHVVPLRAQFQREEEGEDMTEAGAYEPFLKFLLAKESREVTQCTVLCVSTDINETSGLSSAYSLAKILSRIARSSK